MIARIGIVALQVLVFLLLVVTAPIWVVCLILFARTMNHGDILDVESAPMNHPRWWM